MTGFGLSAKHLWLIVGLNAMISTAISLLVVLVVGPWVYTGAVSGLLVTTPLTASQLPAAQGTPLDVVLAQEATSIPTATLTPPPEPILYEVAPGDSLSGIAFNFGVPLAAIMEANSIDDPDTLQAGQTLLIPVGGLAGATPTFTPEVAPTETALPFDPPTPEGGTPPAEDVSLQPTSTPTPIPTATAAPVGAVNVTIDRVLGFGELDEEMVIILNEGPGMKLAGWKLTGAAEGDFDFPNLFLWNGGSVRIHTGAGTNTPSDLYWSQPEARWFSGDTIRLVDAGGKVISTYVVP